MNRSSCVIVTIPYQSTKAEECEHICVRYPDLVLILQCFCRPNQNGGCEHVQTKDDCCLDCNRSSVRNVSNGAGILATTLRRCRLFS